ncbi:hypothetical protein BDV32DRAFT_10576 [Aspergillus pseudonomiae]|nr:hypothetical protein BDV32DRAFT_10576 [Aspergillus pseudonomiae]
MFHSIGDFGDPKIRECSTSIFTTPRVHQKISLLYVRTLLCCARAMQAMSRKRERFRSLIPESLIKPFDFRYDVSLSKFQQHRDEFLAEAHQARFMQRAESIFRGMDEDALVRCSSSSSSFNFGLDRDRTVRTMEEKLIKPMW